MLTRSRINLSSSSLMRRSLAPIVQKKATTTLTTFSLPVAVTTVSSATLSFQSRSVTQVHSQMETSHSRRDQESFLAQYNPMEVIGLYEGCYDMKLVIKSYEQKKKEHSGDKIMCDRLDRAFAILSDPKSPYYERLTWQQGYRQKLMVELLPKDQRRMAKGYAYFWGTVGVIGMMAMLYAFIHPVMKIWRAATR